MIALIPARAGSKRLEMFPSIARENLLDGSSGDVVMGGESSWPERAAPNQRHVMFGQFGLPLSLATSTNEAVGVGVSDVFRWRQILKVVRAIVPAVIVNVVDVLAGWFRADECGGYNASHVQRALNALSAERYIPASARAQLLFHQAARTRRAARPNTFNAAFAGDLVPALKPNDRFPYFHTAIIPVVSGIK